MMSQKKNEQLSKRRQRNSYNVKKKSDRPRIVVSRTGRHMYAQLICPTSGQIIAAASTLEADLRKQLKTGANKDAAKVVGELVAKRAIEKGVHQVVFDRGGYPYHGRVQAVADGARAAGLDF